EERSVWRRHPLPHSSVARNEAFRKADEGGAFDRRLSDGLFDQCDRLLGSRREPEVGERDSKRVHRPYYRLRRACRSYRSSRRLSWSSLSRQGVDALCNSILVDHAGVTVAPCVFHHAARFASAAFYRASVADGEADLGLGHARLEAALGD